MLSIQTSIDMTLGQGCDEVGEYRMYGAWQVLGSIGGGYCTMFGKVYSDATLSRSYEGLSTIAGNNDEAEQANRSCILPIQLI